MPIFMAFASFAKVAFLCVVSLFSSLARDDCFIPAFEASSACIKTKMFTPCLDKTVPPNIGLNHFLRKPYLRLVRSDLVTKKRLVFVPWDDGKGWVTVLGYDLGISMCAYLFSLPPGC